MGLNVKVGVVSLGCPKNLVDSEVVLGLLKDGGYEITSNKEEATVIIVNTCGFIEEAKKESIETILEMSGFKKGNCRVLIVAGCLAQRYSKDILEEIPEVDAVVGVSNYKDILEVIEKALNNEKQVLVGNSCDVDYLNNRRIVSTKEKNYAYIKIAEGCDNFCSYCVIPSIRGKYRSRKIEDISKEAYELAQSGVKEVILVAQDVTRYGIDIYNKKCLVELIKNISKIQGISWIRLMYCYPEEIDDNLIFEIANNEKVIKYIDIPMQHCSDKILKGMGRRGDKKLITNLIKNLRKNIEGIVIRTSLIVGFPGEDESDFEELYNFVKKYKLERLGVFTYSREEGTLAARMKNQVSKSLKLQRQKKLMELQRQINLGINKSSLGLILNVLVEGISEDGIFYFGRSYKEAPEIDGLIYFTSDVPISIGDFVDVKILNYEEYDLIGAKNNESSK